VTITIASKGAPFETGTTVRAVHYDRAGKATVMANVFDDEPICALQKAHVQILSRDQMPDQPQPIDDEPA